MVPRQEYNLHGRAARRGGGAYHHHLLFFSRIARFAIAELATAGEVMPREASGKCAGLLALETLDTLAAHARKALCLARFRGSYSAGPLVQPAQ